MCVCVFFFWECIAATRNMSQSDRADHLSHFSVGAHRTCFSSQHGITGAEILHKRYMEFARAGAVNHGEEDQLVAKLCEMLKYHLRQKRNDLVQSSAKDPVLLTHSSDATSLKCHVQGCD